jgi:hypothetical protein
LINYCYFIFRASMNKPILVFVVHNHQPAGTDEIVMKTAHDACTLPLVRALEKRPGVRVGLHYSGPLLEWMEGAAPGTIESIAQLAAAGRVEIIGGGWQEPVLSVLPLRDAIGQLRMMKRECARLFAAVPRGVWLAGRAWEPELARIIPQAGCGFTFIDEECLRLAGVPDDPLTGHYLTEKGGSSLALLPVSRALRQVVPPRKPVEILGILNRKPGGVWTCAHDGEQFGLQPGSPGPREGGWMESLLSMLEDETAAGRLETLLPSQALQSFPAAGRIYIPTCCADAAGEPSWAGLLAACDEAHHMHRRMLQVSRRVAEKERSDRTALAAPSGEVLAARRALYRSQGSWGRSPGAAAGFYRPEYRGTIYKNLIEAEHLMEPLEGAARLTAFDLYGDGSEKVFVESPEMGVIVDPGRGGAAVEIDLRRPCVNLGGVIRRRKERWHKNIEGRLKTDDAGRHAFHELILGKDTDLKAIAASGCIDAATVIADLRGTACSDLELRKEDETAVIRMALRHRAGAESLGVGKTYTLDPRRQKIAVQYDLGWSGSQPFEGIFAVEINLSIRQGPAPEEDWSAERTSMAPGADRQRLGATGFLESVSQLGGTGSVPPGARVSLGFKCSPSCSLVRYPVETFLPASAGHETVTLGTCLLVAWGIYLENWSEWKGEITLGVLD